MCLSEDGSRRDPTNIHHDPKSDRHSAQKELFGLYDQLIWAQGQWRSCTFLHRDIYKQFTATVCVFSDSVLCLGGKCPQYPQSTRIWENLERYNLDGEPFVFEWEIFPRHTTTQLLHEIQKLMEKELRIQPLKFEERIIFMSMHNDIDWTSKKQQLSAWKIHHTFLAVPRSFLRDIGLSRALETRMSGSGRSPTNPMAHGIVMRRR